MKNQNKPQLSLPLLRFKGFEGEWEKKKIEDVFDYEQPTSYLVNSTNYLDDKKLIPVLTAGKSFILGYTNESSGIYNKGECLIFDDFTMDYKWVNFPFKIKSTAIKILTSKKDNLLFLYNMMKKMKFEPLGHNRHYINVVQNFNILIPSLNEQQKIAKFFSLLDKQISLWERKLELYELFYRKKGLNSILSFSAQFYMKHLFEICDITKGVQVNNVELLKEGNYYYLNGGRHPSGYLNKWNKNEDTISISEGGESCGFVNFNKEKFWSGGHLYTLDNLLEKINKKYLFFYLKAIEKDIMKLRTGGALPNIQMKQIKNIKIKIYNENDQNKIVKRLSNFDLIINLITSLIQKLKFRKQYFLKNCFM